MSDFDQRLPPGWKVWNHDDSQPESADAADRRERELDQITGTAPQKTRSIPLKHLAPLLMDASRVSRAWLEDFADDMVIIDADLHEVLLAYQKMLHQYPGGENRAAA